MLAKNIRQRKQVASPGLSLISDDCPSPTNYPIGQGALSHLLSHSSDESDDDIPFESYRPAKPSNFAIEPTEVPIQLPEADFDPDRFKDAKLISLAKKARNSNVAYEREKSKNSALQRRVDELERILSATNDKPAKKSNNGDAQMDKTKSVCML